MYFARVFIYFVMLDGWSPRIVREEGEHRMGIARPKIPDRERSRKEALWSEHRMSSKRSYPHAVT